MSDPRQSDYCRKWVEDHKRERREWEEQEQRFDFVMGFAKGLLLNVLLPAFAGFRLAWLIKS